MPGSSLQDEIHKTADTYTQLDPSRLPEREHEYSALPTGEILFYPVSHHICVSSISCFLRHGFESLCWTSQHSGCTRTILLLQLIVSFC